MTFKILALALTTALVPCAAFAQSVGDTYKAQYPTANPSQRAVLDQALAADYAATSASWPVPNGPVEGDLCTLPSPAPVNPFTV